MDEVNRAPLVEPTLTQEIAPGVMVIPDQRISLVPNVGIVIGTEAILVVDSGLGRENGERVLRAVRVLAAGKPLIFTSTHAHPEHGSGAQAFQGHATILMNANQADDLRESGDRTLELFRQQGPDVARLLEGVSPVAPDETYRREHEIDLGGKRVLLREVPAHSRGDQIIFLPHERILFTGDLVENHFTPIFFDPAANGEAWIAVLAQLTALAPRIVVPGHGERGSVALIQEYHDYLIFVRDLVQARILEGQTIAVIERDGRQIVQERYPDWDASMWIPVAIRAFYSASTGTVLPPMF